MASLETLIIEAALDINARGTVLVFEQAFSLARMLYVGIYNMF